MGRIIRFRLLCLIIALTTGGHSMLLAANEQSELHSFLNQSRLDDVLYHRILSGGYSDSFKPLALISTFETDAAVESGSYAQSQEIFFDCRDKSLAFNELSFSSSVQHAFDQNQPPMLLLSDTLTPEEFSFAGHIRYTMDGSPGLRTSQIRPYTLAAVGALYTGMVLGLHFYQKATLWNLRSNRFNVAEDGDYAEYVDKYGHFYGGYIMSYYSSEVLQASGVAYEQSRIWGTLMGIAYMTYIEIEDGFATGWAFSPSDFYMNLTGATYHLAQTFVPFLQNINMKWLYTPPTWIGEKIRRNPYDTTQTYTTFNDDYSASTFIISMNIHNMLPKEWKKYWFPWLNLGVGYVVRNLGWRDQTKRIAVSLDWNLVELMPDFRKVVGESAGGVLNWLVQSINYFKLPSPTIEFSQDGNTRIRLFYPFAINLGGIYF